MKTRIIKSILAAFIIIMCVNAKSNAQNYYQVYLCDEGTATLSIPEEKELVAGDKVYWYKDGAQVAMITYNGTANHTNFVTPKDLIAGVHNYTSKIESAAGCMGDMSDAFQIYQLPTKKLDLTASKISYCGSDGSLSSVITATTNPAAVLPDGIGYEYVWTATKNASPVTTLSGIGVDLASKTALNTFTLNTTDPGTYVFNATVKYVIMAPNTGKIKSGDTKGCEVPASAPQTVTVTPKPSRPTIVIQ